MILERQKLTVTPLSPISPKHHTIADTKHARNTQSACLVTALNARPRPPGPYVISKHAGASKSDLTYYHSQCNDHNSAQDQTSET